MPARTARTARPKAIAGSPVRASTGPDDKRRRWRRPSTSPIAPSRSCSACRCRGCVIRVIDAWRPALLALVRLACEGRPSGQHPGRRLRRGRERSAARTRPREAGRQQPVEGAGERFPGARRAPPSTRSRNARAAIALDVTDGRAGRNAVYGPAEPTTARTTRRCRSSLHISPPEVDIT
jgi:hypothetical protein